MDVLLIDDDRIIQRLVTSALSGGHDLRIAGDGDEALSRAREQRPDLILLDHLLPGTTGPQVLEQLRAEAGCEGVPVILLTASAEQFDDGALREIGALGMIPKPFHTARLARRIDELLATLTPGNGDAELAGIRHELLEQGLEEWRSARRELGARPDEESLHALAHRWLGRGGTLGFPRVSSLARRLGSTLERGGRTEEVGRALDEMVREFEELQRREAAETEAREGGRVLLSSDAAVPPDEIRDSLAGRRIALVGLPGVDGKVLQAALASIDAFTRELAWDDCVPGGAAMRGYDAVILHVGEGTPGPPWALAEGLREFRQAVLLLGTPRYLSRHLAVVEDSAFVLTPTRPEEILLRLHQALSRGRPRGVAPEDCRAGQPPLVLVADDDPAITSLLQATLGNYRMETRAARDGESALALARELVPDIVVLDVNMPELDGFEVLADIRNDEALEATAVVMLTARQQETDVIRGFDLGADDYVVKPFNPLELVARLKRLLRDRDRLPSPGR